RRSADEMIRIANEDSSEDPNQQETRRRLLEAAMAYYQEFIELRRDNPDAQAELEAVRDSVQAILADLAVLRRSWQHMLLRSPGVRDDLNLSSDQFNRLNEAFSDIGGLRFERPSDFHRPELRRRDRSFVDEVKAHEAAIVDILKPEQLRRLRQIAVQVA